ncbi:hypothetical protein ESB00_18630 [Oleiharenicola lentus]|uniref:Lipoprotein n=1 Tax=Oleiharenicola lentus TaxID=2508720 RepID=A0A4Q1C5T2_9BACT|nr:hypothetical protein [Oleiharenicola lentus]RXK53703.1 hypothetical protein ESB00_18630 [Oleiharenicola lentus]
MKARSLRLPAGAVALLLGAGCATREVMPVRVEVYGALDLPRDCSVVGISAAGVTPEFYLNEPTTKESAAREISEDMRASPIDAETAILLPAVPLISAILGGTFGGAMGVRAAEVQEGTRTIQATLHDYAIDRRLEHTLVQHVEHLRPGAIQLLPPSVTPPNPGRRRLLLYDYEHRRSTPRPEPPALAPAGPRVDAVLTWRISSFGFSAPQPHPRPGTFAGNEFNPPLRLTVAVDLQAVRTADRSELGGVSLIYQSQPHKFTQWAENDARLLRTELDAALACFQRAINDRLAVASLYAAETPADGRRPLH